MEAPRPATDAVERRLRPFDYGTLLLLCTVLYGFSLAHWRVFTTHETVHCLNVREMTASGDWLVPTYGGRPWLERPPLPHWLTGVFAALAGDMTREWPMRLGSIAVAVLAVVVFASAVATCLGRIIGLLSGCILATMREFAAYAVGPEADIFLASTVTIVGSLFLLQQSDHATEGRRWGFFGGRPWRVLAFFLLLGLTNWMKGPLFGMVFILLPAAGFWLWSRRLTSFRPYVWFWGWLVLIAAGASWPLVAYWHYPDVVELWMVDYGVRWQTGYIGEPAWYYLVQQPWNLFPWTAAVVVGLIVTAKAIHKDDTAALRFIWCWAILPPVFFSFFKGKHHHYLLSCLAPAAVLGAYGTIYLWRWALSWQRRTSRLWMAPALVGLLGSVLLVGVGKKIPGPTWLAGAMAVAWPILVGLAYWFTTRPDGRVAFAGLTALIVVVNCLAHAHRSHYLDSYVADTAFVETTRMACDPGRPLYVVFDEHPLNSSWLLYYLGERARLLHNITFLRDDRITEPEIYLVCRQREETALADYGVAERLAQSARARGESSPADRWTLYRLRFHPHLARVPGDVRISPLQATGRAAGPFLGKAVAESGGR